MFIHANALCVINFLFQLFQDNNFTREINTLVVGDLLTGLLYLYMNQASPRNSPRQSAIAEGFAEANSVFHSNYFSKNIAKVITS